MAGYYRTEHRRQNSYGESVAPGDSVSQVGIDERRPASRFAQPDYLNVDPYAAQQPAYSPAPSYRAHSPGQYPGSPSYAAQQEHDLRFVSPQSQDQYSATYYSAPSAYAPTQIASSVYGGHQPHPSQLTYGSQDDYDGIPLVDGARTPDGYGLHAAPSDPFEGSQVGRQKLYDDPKSDTDAYPPVLPSEAYGEPMRPPLWRRLLRDPTPLDQRIENHKRGIGVQNRPWATWVLSVGMLAAFIVELVANAKAQGTPFSFKPYVNPMLGPSSSVLINVGARFRPCMTDVPALNDQLYACPNNTANPATSICTLPELCGFGGFPAGKPDQTFRFALPIVLHAGLIHIALNLAVQLTSSAQVEREMGAPRYLIVYAAAGVYGFILGGNFALTAQPSVGASGAIFGTHAAVLVDLLAHWSIEYRPRRKLIFLLIEIVLGFALGYVPNIDQFAHLGGFAMGLLLSVWLYPAIHRTNRHRYIFYGLRACAVPLVVIAFWLTTKNFFTEDPSAACHWCRYLGCIPTASNNYCQGTGLAQMSTT